MSDPRPTARELAHQLHPVQMARCACDGGATRTPGHWCEKVTAAIEARDAASDAREDRLRDVLRRIGEPDKDGCCPACGDHEPSCSLDATRCMQESPCFGAIARYALAAIPPRSDR